MAILISLPASSAYALSDGIQPFKQITLKARNELPGRYELRLGFAFLVTNAVDGEKGSS